MRILVLSDNENLDTKICSLCKKNERCVCECCKIKPQEFERRLKARPHVAVVVLSPEPERGLLAIRAARASGIPTIMAIAPVADARSRIEALREGASHCLLEEHLSEEFELLLARLASADAKTTIASMPVPVEGQVIAILAPSSGAGSSTIAINLAAAFAQARRNCILVDLHPKGGDLATLLDLKPTHTLSDVCQQREQLDSMMFARSLAPHEESGIKLLAATEAFAAGEPIQPETIRRVMALAREQAPFVVVDLDDCIHPEQIEVLRLADVVLLVLRLDMSSMHNMHKTLDYLDGLEITGDKVRMIVNRYGQSHELPWAKVQQALGVRIAHYVPDDVKTINRANNDGQPAVLEAPSSRFSREVMKMAQTLNGAG